MNEIVPHELKSLRSQIVTSKRGSECYACGFSLNKKGE